MISKKGLLRSINNLSDLDKSTHVRLKNLESKIKLIESTLISTKDNTLQKQLRCAVKGHNFVFDKVEYYAVVSFLDYVMQENKDKYLFKCSNCNLTIIKTQNELTSKEKKALKDLGILEDNNAKTTKTKTTS